MSAAKRMNDVIRHVWTEPKFVAQVEYMGWQAEHAPSLADQLLSQIGRPAAEQFVSGDGWPDPEQRVTFVKYDVEEIDWDWWEPRHDQPWRRKKMRDAAFDASRKVVDPG